MSELVRANKITVQAQDNGYLAVFHRTHKEVGRVLSTQTTWTPDSRMNKTAQRELFRVWMMDHAPEYGIQYDPEDRRVEGNQMPRRYETDEVAMEWAGKLVEADIAGWIGKIQTEFPGLILVSISADEISERYGWGGRAVQPKYGNGAWAYADIKVTAILQYKDKAGVTTEGYVGMVVNIVSGQLKKPSGIGGLGYTYTGLRTEMMKDLGEVITADTKPAEETKSEPAQDTTENKTVDQAAQEILNVADEKSKKTGRKSKKDNK